MCFPQPQELSQKRSVVRCSCELGKRTLIGLCIALFLPLEAQAALRENWLEWVRPELSQIREREVKLDADLALLGTPVVGQTVPQFGYLHPRLKSPPPTAPWIQVDLGEVLPIDAVALIPAQVDWQPVDGGAHGFPLRFRIDASEDPTFASFVPVGAYVEADFPDPGIAPVTLRAEGVRGRYVRLTVTKLPKDDERFFFAMGELMVLSGNRNVAQGAKVSASAKADYPPRWSLNYVVDGRTALGPPIRRELLPYDGLYSGPLAHGELPWLMVDLGKVYPIEEVRLHPIHARFGADIPGFSFPVKMRVELSLDESFADAKNIVSPADFEFTNPGNNPVTLKSHGLEARYVRVTALKEQRFGLSEVEIYSGGNNVAFRATVKSPGDPAGMSKSWPLSQLVDGYTSYGKLMELPEWLSQWDQRKALQRELQEVRAKRVRLVNEAQRILQKGAVGGGVLALGLIALGAGYVNFRTRRRQNEELQAIRARFAHDLHDEIGSNLAAISVLSQIAQQNADSAQGEAWGEIQEIARESNDALHEVLWVSGARQEMGRDFVVHLRKVARRMLPGREIVWVPEDPTVPQQWPLEDRRQVFLFFKEALSNVVRHSSATAVELFLEVTDGVLRLAIRDNGSGILAGSREGTGLVSLQERARSLGGECRIQSGAGEGTVVELRVPIVR